MKQVEQKFRSPAILRMQANKMIPAENIDKRYGVVERKKAEIDKLSNEVLNNQAEVDEDQAIVNSLTDKLNRLQSQLNAASANKSVALTNNELGEQLVNNAIDLMNSSEMTYKQILKTQSSTYTLSSNIEEVINKLIYSVEVINKFSALVTRKKASNPLISDELITVLSTAGTDANNAVALTMTALSSVFASQGTIAESESSLALEYLQSVKLVEFVLGQEVDYNSGEVLPQKGIKEMLQEAYDTASAMYDSALEAVEDTQGQLDNAKDDLSAAQIRLASSEAGLAAANAAALAS